MPEVLYRNIRKERATSKGSQGTYDIIRGLDENVRNIRNELYIFRREYNRDITDIKQETSTLKDTYSKHDKNIDRLQNDVTELKNDVKELRRDVSDIKGDIKALAAGFGAAQNRFNWGLVILGIIVALIQLLK